jgi:hypothetical protein
VTDKELLELAAKAAGVNGVYQSWFDDRDVISTGIAPLGSPGVKWWNPLCDDGDAFRLASKLNMTVEFGNNCVEYPLHVAGPGTDPFTATRIAIVEAAAEIGRQMP